MLRRNYGFDSAAATVANTVYLFGPAPKSVSNQ